MSIPRHLPYFSVTKSGTTYDFPVQLVPRGEMLQPVAVTRQPKISLPPPIAIGEGSVRRNYDIDEWIQTDFTGGIGADTYDPAATPTSAQTSQADQRFPHVLVSRPLATQLSSAALLGAIGCKVVEMGYASATLLAYAPSTRGFRWTGAAWTAIQNGGNNLNVYSHSRAFSGVYIGAFDTQVNVFRSADGITWDKMAKGAMANPYLVCDFDERLWALDTVVGATPTRNINTVYYSTDVYTAAAGAGTWTQGATFTCPTTELPVKLFTWVDPTDRGRPTLWCLTGARLLYYDYYAATPSWKLFFQMRPPQASGAASRLGSDCNISSIDGNLYVALWRKQSIWRFTGSTIEQLSPNKRGGLPESRRLQPVVIDSNGKTLLTFAQPNVFGGTGKGEALAIAEGGTFSHLYDSSTLNVVGGGVGEGKFWIVTSGGEVWECDNPDDEAAPPNATSRTYDSAANVHTTAWINGGLVNVNKRVLYAELDCIKADGTPGLDTGATLKVEIITRTATTNLGTLTASDSFPAVLAVSGGISCKEWRVRLTLTRGTDTKHTVILRALKIGFRPRPKQRYTYAFRADLRDEAPAFQTPDGKFRGYTAAKLREIAWELSDNDDSGQDDPLVALSFGGRGNSLHPRYTSVAQAEVLVQGQEDPHKGDGLYLFSFSELSAPTSG